jgi:hypothetical protein
MASPEPGTIAVLAEKPSVARDIASVLGPTGQGDGYLHGNGYVITVGDRPPNLFHLRSERPLLAYFQVWIARLLAWWVVPLTLALFWLRYLVRQNPAGTAYHCILTAIAASAAFSLSIGCRGCGPDLRV